MKTPIDIEVTYVDENSKIYEKIRACISHCVRDVSFNKTDLTSPNDIVNDIMERYIGHEPYSGGLLTVVQEHLATDYSTDYRHIDAVADVVLQQLITLKPKDTLYLGALTAPNVSDDIIPGNVAYWHTRITNLGEDGYSYEIHSANDTRMLVRLLLDGEYGRMAEKIMSTYQSMFDDNAVSLATIKCYSSRYPYTLMRGIDPKEIQDLRLTSSYVERVFPIAKLKTKLTTIPRRDRTGALVSAIVKVNDDLQNHKDEVNARLKALEAKEERTIMHVPSVTLTLNNPDEVDEGVSKSELRNAAYVAISDLTATGPISSMVFAKLRESIMYSPIHGEYKVEKLRNSILSTRGQKPALVIIYEPDEVDTDYTLTSAVDIFKPYVEELNRYEGSYAEILTAIRVVHESKGGIINPRVSTRVIFVPMAYGNLTAWALLDVRTWDAILSQVRSTYAGEKLPHHRLVHTAKDLLLQLIKA